MTTPSLRDSRWASKSPSRSTFTTPRYNLNHHHLSAAATLSPSTTPSVSTQNIRPRSLSPSKLHHPSHPVVQPVSIPLTKSQLDLQSRHTSFKNYTNLLRRLKWKSTSLLFSFHRVFRHIANESINSSSSSQPTNQSPPPKTYMNELDYQMPSLEAETMFKIDFFEYYVLLERVLVHLLGVWGLIVSAGYARDLAGIDGDGIRSSSSYHHQHQHQNPATSTDHVRGRDGVEGSQQEEVLLKERVQGSIIGDSRSFTGYKHRFHANVLSALDTQGATPLYEILGTGIVRDYLGIAKEFRNRWKDAEEKEKNEVDDGLIGSRYERLLRDLKLEAMLGEIMAAVERCKGLAEEELRRVGDIVAAGAGDRVGRNGINNGEIGLDVADMEMEYDGEPWGAVDDAMEMD